ncbi:MAG TPA: glutamyl-tRNA reductase [Candidatus Hydrogenedentes bacterium]|nr:glutamyl-tRNA reductase [Candidatus Hydrogenedentota bacterium]HNT87234.1 glutamyl-tRNA reductase [Candidatus Hydrogenedentota bacterium]
MTIALTGISHHTSPLALRERLAFPEARLPNALHAIKKRLDDGGAVILSTCNRVEVYTRAERPAEELHAVSRAFLSEWHDVPVDLFRAALYELSGAESAAHLFRVACSLDSMVVGEAQVLGQVQDAFLAAQAAQATDKILNALFQRALKVAKDVRTQTNIGSGKVSVPSVAVDLATQVFGDLGTKTVMVVGSGETGQLTLKTLIARGVGRVLVVNRNVERARKLAERFRGEPIGFDRLCESLALADIAISSTAAEEPILGPADFQRALRERNQEPMFVIDIAVPRDIDPAVNDLDNVYLYDLDALQQVADQNLEARRAEMATCMAMVDRQVDQFMRWRKGLRAEPAIVSMANELHAIRERELDKTLHALPDLTGKQREEVEYLTKRIVNTILQRPMTQLKREVTEDDPGRVLSLIKRLFGLKEDF